jgi:hypothetical protein
MRKTVVVSLVLFLVFGAGAVWPFAALYDIAMKAQAGDAAGLRERIDFAAVRRSLTRQIIDAYLRLSGRRVDPSGITTAVAGSVADPILEKLVSPEAMLDLLRNGWPGAALPERPPGLAGIGSASFGNWWALFANSEYGLSGFSVSLPVEKPVAQQFRVYLSLSRQGWKLSGLDLPEDIVTKLTEQLIARGGIPTAGNR